MDPVVLREIKKGVRETCPKCKIDYGMKSDKVFIVAHGKCSKCLLEEQIGHPYTPQIWNCPGCKKHFMKKINLERHMDKYDHRPTKQEKIECQDQKEN